MSYQSSSDPFVVAAKDLATPKDCLRALTFDKYDVFAIVRYSVLVVLIPVRLFGEEEQVDEADRRVAMISPSDPSIVPLEGKEKRLRG